MVNLYMWWSIFTLAEQLLFAYQLQIGAGLLIATLFFIRLVGSAFDTKGKSGND